MRIRASFVIILLLFSRAALAQAQPELRWGGDAEGGSPFVEADPSDPTRVVGFEVEIAALLAEGLGRAPRFLQVGFTSLDAAAARGTSRSASAASKTALPAGRVSQSRFRITSSRKF